MISIENHVFTYGNWFGMDWERSGICFKHIFCLWGLPQGLFFPKMTFPDVWTFSFFKKVTFDHIWTIFGHIRTYANHIRTILGYIVPCSEHIRTCSGAHSDHIRTYADMLGHIQIIFGPYSDMFRHIRTMFGHRPAPACQGHPAAVVETCSAVCCLVVLQSCRLAVF